jgi:hypothetical protein
MTNLLGRRARGLILVPNPKYVDAYGDHAKNPAKLWVPIVGEVVAVEPSVQEPSLLRLWLLCDDHQIRVVRTDTTVIIPVGYADLPEGRL